MAFKRWGGYCLILAVLFVSLVFSTSCSDDDTDDEPPTATATPTQTPVLTPTPTPTIAWYTYTIVHTYPHDSQAYTQGLFYHNGYLYEGTGLYGSSSLRKVALETGEIVQIYHLPSSYFGEGITLFDGRLFQLTYREETCFVYNLDDFSPIQNLSYSGEGWGLCQNGIDLIMSDGSSYITFRDPETFNINNRLQVMRAGHPQYRLNELEYIDGQLFANIWLTDQIVIIDPTSGRVQGIVDLAGLLDTVDHSSTSDVLNGIAWDPTNKRLFVTGKWWPALFEITLVRL
ncbi:glutaminyl-peptide cyclotransferase [bacterium]|nr:glutaminyl-peptide cyclotransferase [bacterium]